MGKSIIQAKTGPLERECFLCRLYEPYAELPHTGLHKHHLIHGTANRKKAEHWGLWAYLCAEKHHEYGPEAPHANPEVDLFLKQVAQKRFEQLYDHELFMKEFGQNYLDR